ncbi:MAG: 16S rRNA (uracil(1498)-N(3))-methyltransferase [Terrimesophilobacter sp.]
MAHFYLSDDVTLATVGGTVVVSGSEARHAITVGRLKAGERLSVGDGCGTIVEGVVSTVGADNFVLTVESIDLEVVPGPRLWLAQALAKGDRDELAIQAATELGVDGVIPWAATRSIVRWEGAKALKHEERWRSVVREASKQSVRHRIPVMQSLATTAAIEKFGDDFRLVVLDPTGDESLSTMTVDGRDILLIVGPEGGITPTELSRFRESGASIASLGSRIMRTSTAGPAAIAVLNSRLNRW